MRCILIVAAGFLSLAAAGCGDLAAQRELSFRQLLTTGHTSYRFDLDMSRIPADWIEQRTVEHHQWGETTVIQLNQEHPVKVIVVPADVPSATSPGQ